QLTGRRPLHGAMRHAVDHHAARPADPLATIVIERDRHPSRLYEPLVDDVEHLEERHVRADLARVVLLELARGFCIRLTPDMERDVHWMSDAGCWPLDGITYTTSATTPRSQTPTAPCSTPAACRRRQTPTQRHTR